jgi:hypothetical protein
MSPEEMEMRSINAVNGDPVAAGAAWLAARSVLTHGRAAPLWDFKGRQAAVKLSRAQTSALLQRKGSEGEGAEAAS